MRPMPSLRVISVNAWPISRAWLRDSIAQGPAIRVSGRSLATVRSRMRMRWGDAWFAMTLGLGQPAEQYKPRLPRGDLERSEGALDRQAPRLYLTDRLKRRHQGGRMQ